MRSLYAMLREASGSSAAEYALILAIVGAAIAVAALTLGDTIGNALDTSSGEIDNCAGQC